jgi:HK97 family phage portal protein
MGILTTILSGLEKRSHPSNPAAWLLEMGLKPTASGVNVTEQTSLQSTAVFSCVRILAESEAMLPLILYKRRQDRGRDRATDHRLYPILHDLPNPEMTSMEFRETLTGHVASWGNAYAEIDWSNGGWVRGLWPLRPDKTRPKRVNGRLVYEVKVPGLDTIQRLPFERVMHIKGLGFDGNIGYSPIGLARQAVGLALATEEYGARFFGNGARPSVVLEHPGTLSDTAYDRLRQNWEDKHQGLEKAHRIAILEEGMKVETIGIPPEEAQFLETRKFQVAEIARLFRVPPHMIADLERATFNNIEELSLEFVIYTLMPWLVRWEQAIYRDLLSEMERTQYFAKHLVEGLLRGDIKSRYEAYHIARLDGWMSGDDIRELEDMNPMPDGQGQIYLVPLNMVPVEQVIDPGNGAGTRGLIPPNPPEGREERTALEIETRAQNVAASRRKLVKAYRRLFDEAAGRVIRREVADVRRAVEKYLTKRDAFEFSTWLKRFYAEHKAFWKRQALPVLLSYADQVGANVGDELGREPGGADDVAKFIDAYAAALATREAGSSHLQLQALLDEALKAGQEPEPVITQRLDEWEEKRAGKVARHESWNALNALVLAFYALASVTRKRWTATGETCPYCQALDGKVVEIEKVFLAKDTDFQPEGADRPLKSRVDLGHPPAHGGCDCIVTAA